ncbi:hypothetical protein CC1G_15278 [Coprinopsis cinerea okayama7|uniref:Uncharacterized protein n=1 Tax=Coprinopsis cinerea (strain Okayama-7 / 130 / ATCC MYA-4618 / FGSC 9003) TaxID=240176 RepID=D6RQ55_COPC7|nr:hypothetical protein CC1G_15278 [Coprinopsis cinerea okayama7\|eukprot:XP_002910371.1 hypothetical protein CC1G_15278 [Coprinopsis cinerea okayama7\
MSGSFDAPTTDGQRCEPFRLARVDIEEPGDYVLSAQVSSVTDTEEAVWLFDYLTYEPAFSTVADKPQWNVTELAYWPDSNNGDRIKKILVPSLSAAAGFFVIVGIICYGVILWKRKAKRAARLHY